MGEPGSLPDLKIILWGIDCHEFFMSTIHDNKSHL
jgi:hypothetical protein